MHDYNIAFDLALWDAYRQAVEMSPPPRSSPERPAAPPPTKRNHNKKPGTPARVYASQYVGVTSHHGAFVESYLRGGVWRVGVCRPRTAEGERLAAIDRARRLGLTYLERRDGTREAL